jgi:hypothetical protein
VTNYGSEIELTGGKVTFQGSGNSLVTEKDLATQSPSAARRIGFARFLPETEKTKYPKDPVNPV